MYLYMHLWANRKNPMYHRRKEDGKKTNIVNLIGKILLTNRDASHKSKISMSTFLERENGGKLIY